MTKEMENCLKEISTIKDLQKLQAIQSGDNYDLGMFNGIELVLSILENRDPELADDRTIISPVSEDF